MNIFEMGIERGKEIGKELGEEQGRIRTLVKNVESSMKNFHIDLQTACNGLDISIEEYEKAKQQLALWEKE